MDSEIFLQAQTPIEIRKNETKGVSHWHEETVEIILALKGKIKVQIIGEEYIIEQDEMIFVNKWMVHRVEKINEDAVFIILHLNLKFFENYVENVTKIFFARNPNSHSEEKLEFIRSLFARLIVIYDKKDENYENDIIDFGIQILHVMIKDFNYIEKNPELYQTKERFDRVWEALRYMLDNHRSKISLSEIAKFVYVSNSYLSHCIKRETGHGFEYWLNLFRAESAARLLVSTNMNISDISSTCGFSDPKYLVRYFKNYFSVIPSEYRKYNRIDAQIDKKIIARENDNGTVNLNEINRIIDFKIKSYILGLKEFISDSGNKKHLNLDMNCNKVNKVLSKTWAEYLDLGEFSNLHKASFQYWLTIVQKEIGFSYVLIDFPFDGECIKYSEGECFFDVESLVDMYDFLYALNLKPCIRLDTEKYSINQIEDITKALFGKIAEVYGTRFFENWRCIIPKKFAHSKSLSTIIKKFHIKAEYHEEETKPEHNYLFDTAYITPFFINYVLNHNDVIKCKCRFNKLFDELGMIFMGDTGLVSNGLIKPLYWGYYFLSLLGEKILYQGDGYIVTKANDNLQILLWNHSDSCKFISLEELNLNVGNRYVVFENERAIEININIVGLTGRYKVKRLLFDRNHGSIYDCFKNHKTVRYLSKHDKDFLNDTCKIGVSYGISNKEGEVFQDEVPVNGVVMYLFDSVNACDN